MIVVMISGKMGSGKTALADGLVDRLTDSGLKCYHTRFAKALYEMHDAVLSVMRKYGHEITLDKTLLQILGTQYGRNIVGQDVWVNCFKSEIKKISEFSKVDVVLVSDMSDAIKVRLEAHETVRKVRCSQWRENTQHQSEIDLDGYAAEGKFDLTLNTEVLDKEQTLNTVMEYINERLSKGSGA